MKKLMTALITSAAVSLFAGDPYVGEYVGTIKAEKGNFRANPQLAFLVYREGDTYKVGIYQDLWKRATPYDRFEARIDDGKISFENVGNYKFTGTIDGKKAAGQITDKDKDQEFKVMFSLDKLERIPQSLGEKAPKNAIVLFDGKNFDQWRASNNMEMPWKLGKDGKDGYMEIAKVKDENGNSKGSDIVTKKKFKNFKLHIEFMTPDEMAKTLGQHRANSGVFLGPFEVQILDSFGAEGLWNECGALYKVMPPHINASLPPDRWQTYDIDYRGPKYKNGVMAEYPVITVLHNGMVIHKDYRITEGTSHEGRNRDIKNMGEGPVEIKLQDHGNPIRFRNIWLVEEKD